MPFFIRVRSQFVLAARSARHPAPGSATVSVSCSCPMLQFYDTDTAPVLFSRLSETKLLASTAHWPHLFIATWITRTDVDVFFSNEQWQENKGRYKRTNKPQGRLNHGSICSGTGLRRDEQDGSWCQHEFASLVCLCGELEKTAQSHWVGAPRPRHGGSHQLFAGAAG